MSVVFTFVQFCVLIHITGLTAQDSLVGLLLGDLPIKTDGKVKDKYVPPVTEPVTEPPCTLKALYAVCEIKENERNITGIAYLRQDVVSMASPWTCQYDWLNVQVNINDLGDKYPGKKHGFHIHEYGDTTNGCLSMGAHYNPRGAPHGGPWAPPLKRHIGDLGNVHRYNGHIRQRLVDYAAKLSGPESIIGRGMVLHANTDDLGTGNNTESLKTGNAGSRLACCIIARGPEHSTDLYNLYR